MTTITGHDVWYQPIKIIWLDLDGTLLDSNPSVLHKNFILTFIRRMRPLMPWYRSLILLHRLRRAVEKKHQRNRNIDRAITVFAKTLKIPFESAQTQFKTVAVSIFEELKFCFNPTPGARLGLTHVPTKTQLLLVTNPAWPKEVVTLRLKWAGFTPGEFHGITHGENMRTTKKDPQFYKDVLAMTDVQPEEILFVGDNAAKDLHAVNMGCRVFLLENPHYNHRNQRALKLLPAHKRSLCRRGTWNDLSRFLSSEAQWA